MALHDRLFNELRATCTGVTDVLLAHTLWETINDICRDALVWRKTLEVDLVEDQIEYPITVPGAEIAYALSVAHPTLNANDITYDDGMLVFSGAAPTIDDVDAGPLYFTVALAPALPSGTDVADTNPIPPDIEDWLPAALWPLLHQSLAAGMKERLMAQPAKPWASAQLAAYWHRSYRSQKAIEKRRAYVGNQIGVQPWRFPIAYLPSRAK